LFASEQPAWSNNGYDTLNNLHNAIQKHEKSKSHISSFLQLKTFGTSRIDIQLDSQLLASIVLHNETVKKNREVLKSFIDTVCFLATHELPFHGHNEGEGSLNRGVSQGALNLLAIYDATLSTHLETSTTFRGTSNTIQNDIIRAVSDAVLEKTISEIKNSTFVALLPDETSDIMNLCQLSTTMRYVDSENGQVYERFVSFTNVSANKSANGLLQHVIKTANEFDLSNKLVAQTFDGATVMAGHTGGLRAKVKELYSKAIFVHCFSHKLNLILSQSVSCIKECRIFIQTLTRLGSFFHKSSKRTRGLSEFTAQKLPRTAPMRWNFSSRLNHTVKEHRTSFVGFFQSVFDESSNWDN
jgi:hypothetical protein